LIVISSETFSECARAIAIARASSFARGAGFETCGA
jgi:hypothetical protein